LRHQDIKNKRHNITCSVELVSCQEMLMEFRYLDKRKKVKVGDDAFL